MLILVHGHSAAAYMGYSAAAKEGMGSQGLCDSRQNAGFQREPARIRAAVARANWFRTPIQSTGMKVTRMSYSWPRNVDGGR